MVDPIQGVQMNRIESQYAKSPKKPEAGNTETASQSAKSGQDSVSISFNLYGNVNQLQDSVKVVYQEVRSQLEEYFGVVQKPQEEIEKFEPPENASAQELLEYFNPTNTANRIAGFATGFFEAYQQNHPNATDEENINEFTNLIRGAVDEGYAQAEKILGDYDELGEIGATIKDTYQKVIQNLESFREEFLSRTGQTEETEPTPAPETETGETTNPFE